MQKSPDGAARAKAGKLDPYAELETADFNRGSPMPDRDNEPPPPGDDDAPNASGPRAGDGGGGAWGKGDRPPPGSRMGSRTGEAAALEWLTPTAEWLTEEPPRREYLLHDAPSGFETRGAGLMARGKVGILASGGGVGKTYALCGLALAVVTRRPWLGHFPVGEGCHGRAVLILGEEDRDELRRRLHAQARVMNLGAADAPAVAGILALPGAALSTLALTQPEDYANAARTPFAAELFEVLKRKAEEAGAGWDVVILDPLSRFAGPDVETDNAAATRLIQVLELFTTLPGNPAVIVAHHTTKSSRKADGDPGDATSIRGASGLVDGARWTANMESIVQLDDDGKTHAKITVTKSNYAAKPKSCRTGLLLTRADGSGGLRVATEGERAAVDAAKPKKGAGATPAEKQAAEAEKRREQHDRDVLKAQQTLERELAAAGANSAKQHTAREKHDRAIRQADERAGEQAAGPRYGNGGSKTVSKEAPKGKRGGDDLA